MPSEDTDTKRNRELFGMAGIAKKIAREVSVIAMRGGDVK